MTVPIAEHDQSNDPSESDHLLTPPTETERIEKLKFDTFDPAKPEAYVEEQIKQFKA